MPTQLAADSWLEEIPYAIASHGAQYDARLGFEQGNGATLVVKVAFEDCLKAVEKLLGTQRVTADGFLSRIPPKAHPWLKWLRCLEVTGIKGLPIMANEPVGGVRVPTFETAAGDDGLALIACRFAMTPWVVSWNDFQLAQEAGGLGQKEWLRFTRLEARGVTEYVSRPGLFKYTEGPQVNATVSGNVAIPLPKTDYVLKWFRLPYAGVVDPLTGIATNVQAAVGTCNDDDFIGAARGELLLRHYELNYVESCDIGLLDALDVATSPLLVQITMHLQRFTPAVGAATKGWNTFVANDGKNWAIATVSGGNPMVPYSSFPSMFAML